METIFDAPVLRRKFYARSTVTVARDLLGKVLVQGTAAGRIVEVEAYLGINDLAAHSARGLTASTRVIFGEPGRAYVYLIYGMYECLNFVTETDGCAGCVLIRALEPIAGIEQMQARRGPNVDVRNLTRGPGRLTRALGIARKDNGCDLTTGNLTVRNVEMPVEIEVSRRIGITKSAELPLRFVVRGNAWASGNASNRSSLASNNVLF